MTVSDLEKLQQIVDHLEAKPEALLEDPKFVIALFEQSPDAIIVVGEDGLIRLVNEQAELWFGRDRSEVIGKPIELLIPTEYHAEHRRHVAEYFADPHLRPMGLLDPHFKPIDKLEGISRDGERFEVDVNLRPLRTVQGTFAIATVRKKR